jgi:hypothetical protein
VRLDPLSTSNSQGKPKYSGEPCPSATLSIINLKLLDLGSNMEINCLSYGTVVYIFLLSYVRSQKVKLHHNN